MDDEFIICCPCYGRKHNEQFSSREVSNTETKAKHKQRKRCSKINKFFLAIFQCVVRSICFIFSYILCLGMCGTHTSTPAYTCSFSVDKKAAAESSRRSKYCCNFCHCRIRKGTYLMFLYLTIKLMYLSNVILQLYLMELFVGTEYTFFGIQILYDLARGKNWEATSHFPRVTFCDIKVKKVGENDPYTLQCVLPLNMFLEKVFIFLWFWFIFVAIATLISLWAWFSRICRIDYRLNFVQKCLLIANNMFPHELALTRAFVEQHLKADGIFILRLIRINAGDLVISSLISAMWKLYKIHLNSVSEWQTDLDPSGDKEKHFFPSEKKQFNVTVDKPEASVKASPFINPQCDVTQNQLIKPEKNLISLTNITNTLIETPDSSKSIDLKEGSQNQTQAIRIPVKRRSSTEESDDSIV